MPGRRLEGGWAMRICVVGGDARFARLRLALREYGKARGAAYIFGEEKALDAWETPLQPEDLAMIFSAKERVIGGKGAVALLREESFLRENACLTAEGALVAAASRAPFALLGSVCLVVGYGRIGAALVDRLVGLGAKPVVYSRRAEGRLRAMARGAQAVESLPQALAQANFVFSTPPDLLLTKDVLQYARKEARIVDLASAPYGVDLAAAQEMGLEAWRESGVPGRYCPDSAAEALERAVKAVIDRERGCEQ